MGSLVGSLDVRIGFAAADLESGLASTECSIDAGATYAACSTDDTLSYPADGTQTMSMRAVDHSGNTRQESVTFNIDSQVPTVTITSPTEGAVIGHTAVMLSVGDRHSCALTQDRGVACWGDNSYGQLGDGTTTVRPTPVVVAGVANAIGITAGASHSCALLQDGTARCWGRNSNGQLGDGTTAQRTTPVAVTDLTNAIDLAAGASHSCAPIQDGTARCWGYNSNGQLGDGTATQTLTPTLVLSFAAIVVGFTTNGTGSNIVSTQCQVDGGVFVVCESPAVHGNLAPGAHVVSVRATDQAGNVGSSSVAFMIILTVTITSPSPNQVLDTTSPDVVFSTAGAGVASECQFDGDAFTACSSPVARGDLAQGSHTVTVRATDQAGNVGSSSVTFRIDTLAPTVTITSPPVGYFAATTGLNVFFMMNGTGSSVASTHCQLDAGALSACMSPKTYSGLAQGAHTVTVRATDQAGNVGSSSVTFTIDTLVPTVTITSPSADQVLTAASVVWTADGTGSNVMNMDCRLDAGPLLPCTSPKTYSGLAQGAHTVTVRARDQAGNLGYSSVMFTLDTIVPTVTITSPSEGAVVGPPAVMFAGGARHSCAVTQGGGVACWGNNTYGQLGDGTTTDRLTPVPVTGITNAIGLTAGRLHTCALLQDGTARCWGYNFQGQLGDGTTTNRTTPVSVSGLTNAISLAAGGFHTCALLQDSTARCWGFNDHGELGDGTNITRTEPVSVTGLTDAIRLAAGDFHACALLQDGTARCWGDNGYGGLGDGTTTQRTEPVTVVGLTDAIGITGGSSHTCALLQDGTARCWGYNFFGQLGDGTKTLRTTPVTVTGLSGALSLTAADFHTCAVVEAGTVRCWGENVNGQLGDGSTTHRATPTLVLGFAPIVAFTTSGTGSNIVSTECQLDAGAFSACTSQTIYENLAQGEHTVTVRAMDEAGNVGTASVSFKWT